MTQYYLFITNINRDEKWSGSLVDHQPIPRVGEIVNISGLFDYKRVISVTHEPQNRRTYVEVEQ